MNNNGALWIKQGRNEEYLSGIFELEGRKIPILIFSNKRKSSDRSPDYYIYLPKYTENIPTEKEKAEKMNWMDKTEDINENIDVDNLPF